MERVVDVVVVGAGHLGLTTALGLARAGVEVEVLDTGADERLPWTAVHHWSVLPGLADLGVLDGLLEAGATTSTWGLRVLATGEHLTYDLGDLGGQVRHPYNLRLEESRLCDTLRAALSRLPSARLTRAREIGSVRQHDDGVTVQVRGDEDDTDAASVDRVVRARWLVAAQGSSSAVRRELGLGFAGTTWTERCVVALVEHDFAAVGYPDTTFQVDGRLGAVVERKDDRLWRYTYQEPLSRPEHAVADRIAGVLRAATGADPRVVDWNSARMHQRSVDSYRSGRVVLVGETAHVTHTMTGHTSISGWVDALTLAPVLAEVVREPAAEAVVTAWADERRRVYLDDVVPDSLSRRNLLTQISDPRRLDIELDQFRRARTDAATRREVLLEGREPEGALFGVPHVPHDHRNDRRHP
ncbi:N/A [soil metagenome]